MKSTVRYTAFGGLLRAGGWVFFLALLPFGFSSCFLSNPIQYLGGVVDSTHLQDYSLPDPVIERGDALDIGIFSDNPQATAIFNQAAGDADASMKPTIVDAGTEAMKQSVSRTYNVDYRGEVRLHAIGAIKAEGLTRRQLETEIVGRLTKLGVLLNPYCIVRYLNYKVTVMGEVGNPGVITLTPERPTIIEALSKAGQASIAGRIDKIIVIRESLGKRSQAMVSLADPNIFKSPYYHLKQNDVVIVTADKKKQTAADQQIMQNVTLIASLVSVLVILFNSVIR
jgi:polysaccharide export outer membrane protein